MAIILENTPWEYAVDNGVSVKKLVLDARHPDTIFIQVPAPNPGFKIGEAITYTKGDIYFTGKIWYIYKGGTHVNLYIKHPNPAAIAGTTGGVVHSGIIEPVLKSADAPAEGGEVSPAPPAAATSVAGIMAKAREYKTPLLIGGALILAYMFRKQLFGKK